MDSILNNSSSDKSCSPPGSKASTRGTTPDFDLLTSATSGNSGIPICSMETPNLLQAKGYRYPGELPTTAFSRFNQYQHHQQQQLPMRHMLLNAGAQRNQNTPNWRMSMNIDTGQSQSHGHYHTLSSTSGNESMVLVSSAAQSRPTDPGRDRMGIDTTGFFAYCLDRGNGNYTRLVPADSLPPLVGIPAVQHGAEGMLVLPAPCGLEHQNLTRGIVQPVAFKTPSSSPSPVSDALQKRIDQIIADSPAPHKKPKIYCDKWVHEGVCAFTQQGCKYKHEMPLDKATQHSLGLFHGLPTWWKKQQAELQRQPQQQQQEGSSLDTFHDNRLPQRGVLASPVSPARASQSWRRLEDVKKQGRMNATSPERHNGGGYGTSAEQMTSYQQIIDPPISPCVWGPIGPPSKQTSEHAQMYHRDLDTFSAESHFVLQSSTEDSTNGRGAGPRFDSA
ncbi:chromatin remodeling complex subunit [Colletotrichum truncatum]|uniref:Chromatin remodeling complex subunit n=1 Tax=Colletotrichum truncatum TaxID=5467 RepID=A0ACC3ZF24_COLTU|nr:chromatin remodeling complex subunit [Colletotrichum truncatum]KAF6801377.1 chromatin remodeling complex subunit [Colletotrichum truncatum]